MFRIKQKSVTLSRRRVWRFSYVSQSVRISVIIMSTAGDDIYDVILFIVDNAVFYNDIQI